MRNQNRVNAINLGHHIYGLSAIMFGVITLAWHNSNAWQQVWPLRVTHPEIFAYGTAVIELFGGIAIQWQLTRRIGALLLGGIYFFFALLWVPHIVASPRTYDGWGSFFEQFSLVSAALVVYGATSRSKQDGESRSARVGYMFFGVCVVSFAVEQLAYLSITASLVPQWIPPGQVFWAITTTMAFALAAIAILFGRIALLASRLLTLMLIGFGLLVWLPIVISDPHRLFNWTESAETLAIAGAAWTVADYLILSRRNTLN